MKVKDLSGRTHSWNLVGYTPDKNATTKKSEPHINTRNLLLQEYPTDPILEEVPLPGEQLFFDFYLPRRKTAIEVHGEQHFKFVRFFHGDIAGFLRYKANDTRKSEWCSLNGIKLIILKDSETIDEWRNTIRS